MYQTQDINISCFILKSICLSPFFLHFFNIYEKKDFQSFQVKVKNNVRGEHTQKLRGPILCFTIDIYRLTSKFAAF